MLYRHLVTKSFDWGLVSKSMILDNSSVFTKLEKRYGKVDRLDYAEEVIKSFPDKISLNTNLSPVKDLIADNEFVSNTLLEDSEIESSLKKVAVEMFSNTNPLTGEKDVYKSSKYSSSIPLVVITGTFPPQQDEENNSYFNPDGCVTVAEFLDSLNAIKFGSNSVINRKKSLDNVSDEKDFFNEGYQSCANKYSSPFYNLYTREELLDPITRLELAYITVICWSEYSKKFGSVFSGRYNLGVNVNWRDMKSLVSDFDDGTDYKVSEKLVNDNQVLSINIKDYLKDGSISRLKSTIKEGVSPIPYPMFMCLFELNALGLFYFEDLRLDPIREVSRGELAYFLVRLANVFGSIK